MLSSRLLALLAACTAIGLDGCAAAVHYDRPPEPDRPVVAPAVLQVPDSHVSAVLTADLAPVFQGLEANVPTHQDATATWLEVPNPGSGNGLKYYWQRSPFAVRFDGTTLRLDADISYRGEFARKLGWVSGSGAWLPLVGCGEGADPLAGLHASAVSRLTLGPDWRVHSATSLAVTPAYPPCSVTALGLDASPIVAGLVNAQLARLAPYIDQRVPALADFRSRADVLWRSLQQPLDFPAEGTTLHLLIHPKALRLSPLAMVGTRGQIAVDLLARPEVYLGQPPREASAPLPPLQSGPTPAAFHVAVLGRLPYSEASALLRRELVGQEYAVPQPSGFLRIFGMGPRKLKVADASVTGNGVEAVVAIDFAGDVNARVYLTGHARYDAATRTVSVPDLDFDARTRDYFTGVALWLLQDPLRDKLRQIAFPVGAKLDEARSKLAAALNRQIAPGVRLSGSLDSLAPIGPGLVSSPDGFVVAADAVGRLGVALQLSRR